MIKKICLSAFILPLSVLFVLGGGVDSQGTDQEKVVLELKLPKPMFVGTPRNIRSPNLE